LRRQAGTTELHLHSREADSKFHSATELKLIGKKTDEAVDLTDKFLDEAVLNGLTEVRIIHGHRTGALRKALAELLAALPHVTRFRVRKSFLDRYEARIVGGATHLEYWIPAEDLDEFNQNIMGTIEVTAEFKN